MGLISLAVIGIFSILGANKEKSPHRAQNPLIQKLGIEDVIRIYGDDQTDTNPNHHQTIPQPLLEEITQLLLSKKVNEGVQKILFGGFNEDDLGRVVYRVLEKILISKQKNPVIYETQTFIHLAYDDDILVNKTTGKTVKKIRVIEWNKSKTDISIEMVKKVIEEL